MADAAGQVAVTQHAVAHAPVLYADLHRLSAGAADVPAACRGRIDGRGIINAFFSAHNVDARAVERHFVNDQLFLHKGQHLIAYQHRLGRQNRFPRAQFIVQNGKPLELHGI